VSVSREVQYPRGGNRLWNESNLGSSEQYERDLLGAGPAVAADRLLLFTFHFSPVSFARLYRSVSH
jgi:hypothetical protein